MISLDSNIILIALDTTDNLHKKAEVALEKYQDDTFCICPPVYAELRAAPNWLTVQEVLSEMNILIDWAMPQAIWEKVSRIYADQRKGGKLPRRILADHLIAAHAEIYGFNIMSFDETVYKVVLEKSKLITP
jgi:predicted nucleic acid-binding protein